MEREELLKSAKALYEYHFTSDKLKHELEDAFPELKKSEDERIREDMVTYLRNELHNITQPTPRTNEVERWITYLENQPTNEEMLRILRAEYEKGVADTILKYGQKPIFRVGDIIIAKDGTCIPKEPFHIESIEDGYYWDKEGGSILIGHQDEFQLISEKPMEWSEEDKLHLNNAILAAESNWGVDSYTSRWLKNLPERFGLQSKQEWSEEDEDELNDILAFVKNDIPISGDTRREFYNWLKSLRPPLKDREMKLKILKYLSTRCSSLEFEEVEDYLNNLRPSWKSSEEQINEPYNAAKIDTVFHPSLW